MSQEQLDAVKEQLNVVRDQLITEGNDTLRESMYTAFMEDAMRGANMIVAFARDKGLELEASQEDIVQVFNTLAEQLEDDDELADVELTEEELTYVSGGIFWLAIAAKAFFQLSIAGAGVWVAGKAARVW